MNQEFAYLIGHLHLGCCLLSGSKCFSWGRLFLLNFLLFLCGLLWLFDSFSFDDLRLSSFRLLDSSLRFLCKLLDGHWDSSGSCSCSRGSSSNSSSGLGCSLLLLFLLLLLECFHLLANHFLLESPCISRLTLLKLLLRLGPLNLRTLCF